MTLSPLANSYILGWSVAWPPGPINAEMIRRGLPPKDRRGGFWLPGRLVLARAPAIPSGPLAFPSAQGALLNSVGIRRVLAIVSLALLVFLGFVSPLGRGKSITGIAVSSFKRQKANDTAISYLVFLWC
jgi:hypothetical protein